MWLISKALYESLHCSQEQEVESLEESSSDGKPSVQSSGSHTQLAYLPPDKMTAFSRLSRFGMTFKPLTADRGEELLMSFREGFHAKLIPQQRLEKIQQTTFGLRCGESWQMSLPGTFLPKTSAEWRLTKPQTTVNRWVTKPKQFPYQRQTWVQTTFGEDIGYLHTPTTMANFCAPSMQKHAGCRNWVKVFGKITPNHYEWLMGWPIGWTDLKPLATDKSLCAPQKHGEN